MYKAELWKLNIQNKKETIMSTDERIEKMERQLARMRWFNRCLIACIVLSLGVWFIEKTFTAKTAWAGSGVKEIRANRFILEDDEGTVRARLGVDADGPALSLLDKNGKSRAVLSVDKDVSGLRLRDENSKPLAVLSMKKDGAKLSLWDKNEVIRAMLSVDVDKDVPWLALFDENGETRVGMGVTKEGPGLALCDENGKMIWKAP